MKVCGFSFVRNGVAFDYPFVEAIRSILPLCDEVIVAVGNSTDNTLEKVRAIDPRVKAIPTIWNEGLRDGGQVLAEETDKAFSLIPPQYDWAFYIQADEVLHEKYVPVIRDTMQEYLNQPDVDGLLFNYLHFFGSYDYVGSKYSWYRREIRIVRNRKDIHSYRDAQGFRKTGNHKLRVKPVDAYIYHYGWARNPAAMKGKENFKIRYYKNDDWIEQHDNQAEVFEYNEAHEPVEPFRGTHPAVMRQRVQARNWSYQPDLSYKYVSFKDRFKRFMGKWTGWYPGEYRNYTLI